MRLVEMLISGFKSFVKSERLVFPDAKAGLYFVRGKNKSEPRLDPNATGKSSIWDALSWVFYGKTARGLEASQVINWGEEELCSVSLKFTRAKKVYVLTRVQSPNTLTLSTEYSEPIKIVQSVVDKLVGMTYVEFLHVALMSQFGTFFFDLSPTDKLNLFSEALDLTFWAARADACRRSAKEAETKVAGVEKDLARQSGEVNSLKQQRDDLQKQADEWDATHDQKKQDLHMEHEGLVVQLELLKGSARARRRDRENYEAAKHDVEQALIVADRDARDAENRVRDLTHQMRLEDNASLRAKDDLAEVINAKRCPTCGQRVDKTHLARKRARLEEVVQATRDSLSQTIAKLKKATETHGKASEERKRVNTALVDAERLLLAAARKEGESRDKVKTCETELASVSKALADVSKGVNAFKKTLKDVKERIGSVRSTRATLKTQREQLQQTKSFADFWASQFKELRLWLVDEALRELEVDVNNSLIELGLDGWSVTFDVERENTSGGVTKGFTVLIKSPDSPDSVHWKSWCGGETQRLRLAGAMGLASLITRRKGIKFPLEVFDEPTQHLNERGVDDLVSFFASRARDEQKQIWLIDHRSLKSGDFDGDVLVVKDDKGSHIVQL